MFDQVLLCLKSEAASVRLKENYKKYITYQIIKNSLTIKKKVNQTFFTKSRHTDKYANVYAGENP